MIATGFVPNWAVVASVGALVLSIVTGIGGGGGGGGSWAAAADALTTHTQATRSGNGTVTISW